MIGNFGEDWSWRLFSPIPKTTTERECRAPSLNCLPGADPGAGDDAHDEPHEDTEYEHLERERDVSHEIKVDAGY